MAGSWTGVKQLSKPMMLTLLTQIYMYVTRSPWVKCVSAYVYGSYTAVFDGLLVIAYLVLHYFVRLPIPVIVPENCFSIKMTVNCWIWSCSICSCFIKHIQLSFNVWMKSDCNICCNLCFVNAPRPVIVHMIYRKLTHFDPTEGSTKNNIRGERLCLFHHISFHDNPI